MAYLWRIFVSIFAFVTRGRAGSHALCGVGGGPSVRRPSVQPMSFAAAPPLDPHSVPHAAAGPAAAHNAVPFIKQ